MKQPNEPKWQCISNDPLCTAYEAELPTAQLGVLLWEDTVGLYLNQVLKTVPISLRQEKIEYSFLTKDIESAVNISHLTGGTELDPQTQTPSQLLEHENNFTTEKGLPKKLQDIVRLVFDVYKQNQ